MQRTLLRSCDCSMMILATRRAIRPMSFDDVAGCDIISPWTRLHRLRPPPSRMMPRTR